MTAKILIVDDEPDLELLIRQRFRREMRDGTYHFAFARHGEEALSVLDSVGDVELVLTDINMPVMDGLTLLERVRERQRPPATVVVSAYGDMPNIRAAMNNGAVDFLTKPIDFHDFEATVKKSLGNIRRQRAAEADSRRLTVLEHDLATAAEIQRSFLPEGELNGRSDVTLCAAMTPARAVGGDFYDYFSLDDGRLGLVVGDVSGKGMPAALFMAVTRTLVRAVALRGIAPGECLGEVNRVLLRDAASSLFVTLFYGVLDPRVGTLAYSNAGHNPPFALRSGAEPEELPGRGLPAGAIAEATYLTRETSLYPSDLLYLYTDGVTEAMNSAGDLFTTKSLREALARGDRSSPASLMRSVLEEVRRFTGDAPQSDDLTALAVRYCGHASSSGVLR
jgi:sigma-B regulation protein RsbU (phosphoserine phosphatase)